MACRQDRAEMMRYLFVLLFVALLVVLLFTVTPVFGATAKLAWDPPSGLVGVTVVSYNVKRATVAGGPYVKVNLNPITVLPTNLTPWYDSTVPDSPGGARYYYVVTAMFSDGTESAVSNEAFFVAPVVVTKSPPVNLRVVP